MDLLNWFDEVTDVVWALQVWSCYLDIHYHMISGYQNELIIPVHQITAAVYF